MPLTNATTQHCNAACARKLSEVQEREAAALSEFNRAKTALAAAEADHQCVAAPFYFVAFVMVWCVGTRV